MHEAGLRAIEVVGKNPDSVEDFGALDLLVFADGNLLFPGVHYTFDGSKLDFNGPVDQVNILIYSRVTGSYRFIKACELPLPVDDYMEDPIPVPTSVVEPEPVLVPEPVKKVDDDVEFTASAGGYGPEGPEENEEEVRANFESLVDKAENEVNDSTVTKLGDVTESEEVE